MITKIKRTYVMTMLLLGAALFVEGNSHMGDTGSDMQMRHSCPGCMMHGEGIMDSEKCMTKMQPMGRCMMHRDVVPTEDGGVLILMGPFLFKYDADLNLVKKTEIDLTAEDMEKMMSRHQHMREMMMDSSDDEEDE